MLEVQRIEEDQHEDHAVINAVLAGDVQRFEALVRRYNRPLYRAVRSILVDETDVEETMQEAYVNAFLHLNQFAGRAKFSTWLLQIGINAARKKHHRNVLGSSLSNLLPPANDQRDPEKDAASSELSRVLTRAIDALPDGARTVFMLVDVEGCEAHEVAETLAISPEALRVRLHRARAELKRTLTLELGVISDEVFTFYRPRCDRMTRAVLDRISPA